MAFVRGQPIEIIDSVDGFPAYLPGRYDIRIEDDMHQVERTYYENYHIYNALILPTHAIRPRYPILLDAVTYAIDDNVDVLDFRNARWIMARVASLENNGVTICYPTGIFDHMPLHLLRRHMEFQNGIFITQCPNPPLPPLPPLPLLAHDMELEDVIFQGIDNDDIVVDAIVRDIEVHVNVDDVNVNAEGEVVNSAVENGNIDGVTLVHIQVDIVVHINVDDIPINSESDDSGSDENDDSSGDDSSEEGDDDDNEGDDDDSEEDDGLLDGQENGNGHGNGLAN